MGDLWYCYGVYIFYGAFDTGLVLLLNASRLYNNKNSCHHLYLLYVLKASVLRLENRMYGCMYVMEQADDEKLR